MKAKAQSQWLILDANNICHRVHYKLKDLRWKGQATGVIYGFLRTIRRLEGLFNAEGFVFCFDSSVSRRIQIDASYKNSRLKKYIQADGVERREMDELRSQMALLRKTILPILGYKNIFRQEGYEADDLIASTCESYPKKRFIVVSTDSDLFQVLRYGNNTIWNPATEKPMSLKSFQEEYHIPPTRWPLVKAIAGDRSDDITGVHGVGIKTAVKYVRGIPPTPLIKKRIMDAWAMIKHNLKLVTLPLDGTDMGYVLRKDEVKESNWKRIIKLYGLTSLMGR